MSKVSIIAGALRSSLGQDPTTISRALIEGRGGPSNIALEGFSERQLSYFPIHGQGSPGSGDDEVRLLEMLETCANEALSASGLDADGLAQTGLFLGSSSFAIGGAEQQYRQRLEQDNRALALPYQRYGDFARHLSHRFGLAAGEFTFSTACTSSANALLYAAQAVRSGRMQAALVVGVEGFNLATLLGFDSLQLLSHSGYRPFDRNRAGLVLGEGVAAVVVASQDWPSPAKGWEGVSLLGGANGCDPSGLTCSSAKSMADVIQHALVDAETTPEAVTVIKAHATGSESNDAAEAAAMRHIFDAQKLPPLTALKGALGHTLGASGVLELAALVPCLKAGSVPPTTGFSEVDPQLDCHPLLRPIPFSGGRILNNCFGFGGNNTSFVLEVD